MSSLECYFSTMLMHTTCIFFICIEIFDTTVHDLARRYTEVSNALNELNNQNLKKKIKTINVC